MLKRFIQKITNSIQLHGLKFTLQLMLFLVFGGKDPRNTEEFVVRMQKHLEPGIFKEAISPFWLNPDALSQEDVLSLHRALLPIDYMPFLSNGRKRINLVLDSLNELSFEDTKDVLKLSAGYALAYGYDFRIITRCSPCNPALFYKMVQTHGIRLPQNVEFYNDISRNNYGDCQFKLSLLPEDVFIVTSWYSAIAVSRNTIYPAVFYYINRELTELSLEQQDLIFRNFDPQTFCIIPQNVLYKDLLHRYSALSARSICMETSSKETFQKFMETCI